MLDNEHVVDSLPAFSLGSLDPEEQIQVSRHLEICAFCQAELRAYQEIVGEMALAVKVTEPPEEIKDRILTEARSGVKQGFETRPQGSWYQGIVRSLSLYSPAISLVSLVLVLLLAASNLYLWWETSRLRAISDPLPLQIVALRGTEFVPEARGILVIGSNGQHGTLVVDELPPLEGGLEYQLWLIKDGERDSGAIFSVDVDGYGAVWVASPQPLVNYTGFGITIEPEGGSPGPTGERVLASDF